MCRTLQMDCFSSSVYTTCRWCHSFHWRSSHTCSIRDSREGK